MTTPGASDPSQRTPQERASDPATSALELQQLAADHPEVRPAIAKHPKAYPALLDWLGALGDSAVNAALVERRSADAAPPAPVASTPEPEVTAPAESVEPASSAPEATAAPVVTEPAESAPEPAETVQSPEASGDAFAPAFAPVQEESSEPVAPEASSADDVAESASPAPVAADSASEAQSAPEVVAPVESAPEPEATQISPVSAEPAPVVTDVESAARQRASVFAAVQAAQEQTPAPTAVEDSASPTESTASGSPDVAEVIAGALGADVTERSEPQSSEPSAPEPEAPSNPFSREFSAQPPEQQSAPATESVSEPSPYAPPGYGAAVGVGVAGSGVSAPTAPAGAPPYGTPAGQYGQPGQQSQFSPQGQDQQAGAYGQQDQYGQQGQYGQPGYSPEPAPAPAPKVHDGRGFATILLISLALGASVIALWDSEVFGLNATVYGTTAAVLLLVAAVANLGVLFRALRRGFAGLAMWASFTFAVLVPAVFYNVTIAAVDLADAAVDGGSPLDLLMRAQNSTYSAIDSEWGRLVYMALPLVLALITFVVALTKRKAALAQLADADEDAADTTPAQQQF